MAEENGADFGCVSRTISLSHKATITLLAREFELC
jgi:hypothetical protein